MSGNKITNFKHWQSPISLDKVFSKAATPTYLHADNGRLFWMEQDPTRGGTTQLKYCQIGQSDQILISEPFSVRTRANEYGGKAFTVSGNTVFFCNDIDQRIYCYSIDSEQSPRPVTPDNGVMYADLIVSKDGQWLFFVMETPDKPENRTEIGVISTAVSPDELQSPNVLVCGNDFYASLTLSADNQHLAWVEWRHPNMPWDKTHVAIAELNWSSSIPQVSDISLKLDERIASLGDGATVAHVNYSPRGNRLFMTLDWQNAQHSQNYAQLYQWHNNQLSEMTTGNDEYSYPHWIFGNQRYAVIHDKDIIAIGSNRFGDELYRICLETGEKQRLAEDFVRFTHICVDQFSKQVFVVADSQESAGQVLCIHDKTISVSARVPTDLSEANISHAEPIYVGNDTQGCHAFFYPPRNIQYNFELNKSKNLPPLLVMVHGGPTARAQNHFDIQKQFWTTSGFAVLDINHRGSSGFGRRYRDALLGQWGVVDTEDIYQSIRSVVEQGLASDLVFIRGKSAGGYAVQRALTLYPSIFTAGASYYGIGDLATLAEITHKFEAKYCDQLLGEIYNPKTAQLPNSVYFQRSPIHAMDNLACPMILFQGMQDKIVPPELAEQVVKVLQQQGIQYEYYQYDEEGHGFRSVAAQIDSLTKELSFYRKFM